MGSLIDGWVGCWEPRYIIFAFFSLCCRSLLVMKTTYIVIFGARTFRPRRERSGSVVECLTRDRRVAGSSLTGVTVLWSLSKTHLS